jgi:hypothetical protein
MIYRYLLLPAALVQLVTLVFGRPLWAGEHSQHVALFGGASVSGHAVAPAMGLEYEYRLPYADRLFGVGPLVEATFGAHDTPVLAVAGVTAHPLLGLKFFALGGSEVSGGHAVPTVRVGVGYDFPWKDFSLTPVANLDFAHGHWIQVYGVAVGMGFGE